MVQAWVHCKSGRHLQVFANVLSLHIGRNWYLCTDPGAAFACEKAENGRAHGRPANAGLSVRLLAQEGRDFVIVQAAGGQLGEPGGQGGCERIGEHLGSARVEGVAPFGECGGLAVGEPGAEMALPACFGLAVLGGAEGP